MSNLPKGWELVQFDKVCDIRDGTHDSPKYIENGVPFITSKHLTDNGINFTETNYISEENHIEFSKRSKVDNGDILFGMIGTIGKPVIVNTDFEFSIKNVALLKLSSNELLSNIYVLNLLKSNIIINQFLKLSNGGVQSFIALGMIRKLKIPLPPIEEQKKIADILSTVDKKIAFVEENINATEELKKALMQKLLTEGIGHTEFKDSELGRIPQSWEVVKFKEITKVRQGLQIPISKRKKEKCENCYEYITIQFIKNNKEVEYIENPQKTVICTENDILMTRTGNTGIVVTNVKGVFHNNFFLIDFDRNEISKEYLVYYLNSNSIQKEILLRAGATTIPDLNHGDFYSIKFISPPLEEQKQIAEILSTVDNKLENLKEQKQSFEELNKGPMQKLPAREVRV